MDAVAIAPVPALLPLSLTEDLQHNGSVLAAARCCLQYLAPALKCQIYTKSLFRLWLFSFESQYKKRNKLYNSRNSSQLVDTKSETPESQSSDVSLTWYQKFCSSFPHLCPCSMSQVSLDQNTALQNWLGFYHPPQKEDWQIFSAAYENSPNLPVWSLVSSNKDASNLASLKSNFALHILHPLIPLRQWQRFLFPFLLVLIWYVFHNSFRH